MLVNQAAVVGAGSWGTALARLLSRKGCSITLWAHRQEHVDEIVNIHENLTYLPGFKLADNITATADIKKAVQGQSVVAMVVPSHGFRMCSTGSCRTSPTTPMLFQQLRG